MAVLCIVQDSHFVVIEVNFLDEGINQCLSVFSIVDVSLTEPPLILFVAVGEPATTLSLEVFFFYA